ncbi:I66 family serine proteinase inhibitor [Actinokineospora inagensis]|uniref:I66 family serine proteinase inhibitor n=1 Tax=Actinokineospora inagensis TaxID=103730 RepID=UPI0004099A31|nr:I66 family serine proteinase inhibitor [Actinokineospora inagensis]
MRVVAALAATMALVAGAVVGATPAVAGRPVNHVNGVYVVTTQNGQALVDRGGVVGLGAPAQATRWRLDADRSGAYLITTPDRSRGWVLKGTQPSSPVTVAPLIVFPTWPPTYPRNELWKGYLVDHTANGAVVTITSATNDWPVVPSGDHLVVIPETFAPVTYTATRVGD